MAVANVSLESTKRRVRISIRAVAAGALVGLALLALLMALARSFGSWLGFAERQLGAGFAVYGIAAWIVSALAGSYMAAVVSRSADRRDGIVHGIVTWATAVLGATIAARLWIVLALAVKLVDVETIQTFNAPRVMLAFFLADALALIAAIVGGIAGSRAERTREIGAGAAGGPSVEWHPSEQPQPAR
ncbi:MAG TPA: hypothetical protein VMJ10_04725 [Kofleriaceae bacterium]|nr:hypothetical protein [Kofleriaceae bacterium]